MITLRQNLDFALEIREACIDAVVAERNDEAMRKREYERLADWTSPLLLKIAIQEVIHGHCNVM